MEEMKLWTHLIHYLPEIAIVSAETLHALSLDIRLER